LLHASLLGHICDLVVFVGCLFHLVERRVAPPVSVSQACRNHLRDADFLGPFDALVLAVSHLAHREVRALAFQAIIYQNPSHFFSVRQGREFSAVTDWRTQFEPGYANPGNLLSERRKIFEHRTHGPYLAANGKV
jgi:hypothetical protein